MRAARSLFFALLWAKRFTLRLFSIDYTDAQRDTPAACVCLSYRYLLSYRRAYISLSRVSSGSGLARSRETACVSLEKKKKQKSETLRESKLEIFRA